MQNVLELETETVEMCAGNNDCTTKMGRTEQEGGWGGERYRWKVMPVMPWR